MANATRVETGTATRGHNNDADSHTQRAKKSKPAVYTTRHHHAQTVCAHPLHPSRAHTHVGVGVYGADAKNKAYMPRTSQRVQAHDLRPTTRGSTAARVPPLRGAVTTELPSSIVISAQPEHDAAARKRDDNSRATARWRERAAVRGAEHSDSRSGWEK